MAYQVAIIGSFRKYYDEILNVIQIFKSKGLYVWSPRESEICASVDDFVIFESDNQSYTPSEIQMVTLERILRADVIYVYNPNGYIGRTTCYEIGFCISRCKPIYFFDKPKDLPIPFLIDKHIVSPDGFADLVLKDSTNFVTDYGMCKEATIAFNKIYGINEFEYEQQKKIVICGSMQFYDEMLQCQEKLKQIGLYSIVPKEENEIIQQYTETQFIDFKRKASNAYLKKIREKSTMGVLIYNGKKHGAENYIGANTLVELAMAFSWHRKIFLYNDIYEPLKDELLAWRCICLNGNINNISKHLLDTQEQLENSQIHQQLSLFI